MREIINGNEQDRQGLKDDILILFIPVNLLLLIYRKLS